MLVRMLVVTFLSCVFCLQQALAEEVPPPPAAEAVPSIPAEPPAAAPAPAASLPAPPPAAVPAPESYTPPGPVAGMPSENLEAEMEQRIKAYRELYDTRKLETLKQLEDARRRFEAREKAYAEKVEAYLKQREERLEQMAKHYDDQRQSIASERDYLVDHHQELLQMAVDRKEAMIKRQEDLRNEAEERKARLAGFLSAMEDMTPQERHNYINDHYKEMFDRSDELPGAYPGGPQSGPLARPPYGENPYSRLPAAPQ